MTNSNGNFAGTLAEVLAEKRRLAVSPSPQELLAYHNGQLSEAEQERIRERLILFPEATNFLLDLDRFPNLDPRPGIEPISETEIAQQWQQFQQRTGVTQSATLKPATKPRFLSYRLLATAAAVLLATTVLLSLRMIQLNLPSNQRFAPRLVSSIFTLYPALDPSSLRTAGIANPIVIAPNSPFFLLSLNVGQGFANNSDGFEVRLVNQANQELWRREAAPPQDGHFNLEIDRKFLPSGVYQLEIIGRANGIPGQRLVYEFHVNYPPTMGAK